MLIQNLKTVFITGLFLFCSVVLFSQQTKTIPIDPLDPSGINIATGAIYVIPSNSGKTVIKPTNNCPSVVLKIDNSNKIIEEGANNFVDYITNSNYFDSKTINTNLPVGRISGSGGVSPSGASTYEIPIFCSPGTNGVQPQLSISYNSQSGNGTIGWGWDLFGTSTISRTSKTLSQDGVVSSVEMESTDVYAIDGNRIYEINNGNHSPGGDTYYNSEFADFSTLYSKGNSGNGPLYFEKIEADGTIRQYGFTPSSRKIVNSSNTIGLWRLNRVTDINGNYIIYNYNNAGLLSSIEYTGNEPANKAPYNKIVFKYALRGDNNVTYPAYSTALQDNYLLTEIQIINENQLVKKYLFKYTFNSNDLYSLLSEIIESDANGLELNSTVIDWNGKLEGNSNQMQIVQSNMSLYSVPSCNHVFLNNSAINYNKAWYRKGKYKEEDNYIILKPNFESTVYGDFDGDGYLDIFSATTQPTPTTVNWSINLYKLDSKSFGTGSGPDYSGTLTNTVNSDGYKLLQPIAADIDGNGKDEIGLVLDYKNQPLCRDSIDIVFYQLDNSSLTEIPNRSIKNLVGRGICGNAHDDLGYYISFIDMDSDGKEDEMVFDAINNDRRFIYNQIPQPYPNIDDCEDFDNSNIEYLFQTNANYSTPIIAGSKMKFTDINGNGKPEVMYYYQEIIGGEAKYKYSFHENNENLYNEVYTLQQSGAFSGDSVYTGDFNGDSKTDLLVYVPTSPTKKWKLMISQGNKFETIFANNNLISCLSNYTINQNEATIICQDYNGDGKTDVFIAYENNPLINAKIFYSNGRNFKEFDYGVLPDFTAIYPIGDMNGDGNADILLNKRILFGDACSIENSRFLFINPNKKPLLVKQIKDGFLQTISFTYKPMSDVSVYTKGNNTNSKFVDYVGSNYLVSNYSQPNGIGGTTNTSYTYAEGIIHKYGKGLLGFAKVISQNDATLTKTESYYEPDDDYLKMDLTLVKTFVDNTLTSQIENTYNSVALNGSNQHGYYKGIFSYISQSTITDYLSGITVEKEFDYGANTVEILQNKGNIKTLTENYGTDGNIISTNTYEENTYTTVNGSLDLTKLKETEIVKTIGTETFTKTTEYTYYASGLLESIIDFSNTANGAITKKYDYTGNSFGNITKETSSASGMSDRYILYEYDSDYGRFITKKTNMLGQETLYEYNTKFGLKTSETDVLGNTITYQYNSFGDLIQENLPIGFSNQYGKNWNQNPAIVNCLFYAYAQPYNAPDVEIYYDAFGREVGSFTLGLGSIATYTNKEYNAKGLLSKSCLPYRNGQTKKWTTNTYDTYNRPLSVDNNGLTTTYAYNSKTITVTGPDMHAKSKTINNMGLVMSADDNGGSISYAYHGSGAVKEITTLGSTIVNSYDALGRLKGSIDPDAGESTIEYNTFGEIIQQTDGNGNIYSFTYDNAGRALSKVGSEGTYTYNYIPVTAAIGGGLLNSVSLNGESISYTYNQYGQVLSETKVINSTSYIYNYEYDNKGNNTKIIYPNGFAANRTFDGDGRLFNVARNDNQKTIWQVDAVNELGLPTQIRQGDNTLQTTYQYDNYYHLTHISNLLQNDEYLWNANNGNLLERTNHIKNLTEEFEYDNLDRLTKIKLNNELVKEIDYSPNGNINSKTDAGTYSYDPIKVHAVVEIEKEAHTIISDEKQEITYTPFRKVKTIKEETLNGDSLVYYYGPDMQRNRMELYSNGTLLKSRIYVGKYEIETTGTQTVQHCYFEGVYGISAVMITKNATNTMYYLLRDQQGSITGIVNDQRNLVEEYSYDAWGRRRNPNTWTYDNTPVPQYMYRGYTMHEMLDNFDLINMNGRCYDPVIARFLSPDIIVQDGNNTQCYNKYSYCVNNPLKYTDPSGWSMTQIMQINYANMKAATMRLQLDMPSFSARPIESGARSRFGGICSGNSIVSQTDVVNIQQALVAIGRVLGAVYGGVFGTTADDGDGEEADGKLLETELNLTVVNNSPSTVYILSENNTNPKIISLEANGIYYGPVDGVATCLFSKFVFKIPDIGPLYGDVVISENCDVDLDLYGLGPIFQHTGFKAGWKDVAYFNDFDLTRNGWQLLFDAAKTINK